MYCDDGMWYQKPCSCGVLKKLRTDSRLRFAELPEAYKDVRLKSFNLSVYKNPNSKKIASVACKAVKYYLENFGEMYEKGMGLYFVSNCKGSGKTRMAASLANELIIEKGVSVKFATSIQILNEIRETYDNQGCQYTQNQLLDSLSTTDVLVIDDFGTEKATDWVREMFYAIINGRYTARKVTIFTSNDTLEELRYDDRVIDRIKERSYTVAFPEESVRDTMYRGRQEEMLKILGGTT